MYYLAFLLGLASSMHCVGMCGPIALALPVNRHSPAGKTLGILLYNSGRITVYAVLGVITGSIGFLANAGDWQRFLSVGAGILLVAAAIGSFRWWDGIPAPPLFRSATSFVQRQLRERLSAGSFTSLSILGMLNGLLPCGMVYMALVSALATPDALSGAQYMAFFGLGTLPAMLATGFMGQWASLKWRAGFRKAVPYLMAAAGIVLIVRGLVPAAMHDHHEASKPIPLCTTP